MPRAMGPLLLPHQISGEPELGAAAKEDPSPESYRSIRSAERFLSRRDRNRAPRHRCCFHAFPSPVRAGRNSQPLIPWGDVLLQSRWLHTFRQGRTNRMPRNTFKIVIFTSVPPRQVARIMARICRDVPEAQVAAVLYERRPPSTLHLRIATWFKKMKRLVYWRYVLHRIFAAVDRKLTMLLDAFIRFIHAAPKHPNGNTSYRLDDFNETCKSNGTEFFIARDIHSEHALDFVRRTNADLGLVFGTRILKPALFEIPKQGSINIHKRKVPDYRGGGAVGLWELLDDQKEIGVTVHRVESKVDVGGVIRSALIPIEPFDDLESLALKADVVGTDIIVAAIRDFANGTVTATPRTGPGNLFRSPTPADFLQIKT